MFIETWTMAYHMPSMKYIYHTTFTFYFPLWSVKMLGMHIKLDMCLDCNTTAIKLICM